MYNIDIYTGENEEWYKKTIFDSFKIYFDDYGDFSSFVGGIEIEKRKIFMHIALVYHYLINHSSVVTDGKVISYYDDSYKLITIVSLMEATVNFHSKTNAKRKFKRFIKKIDSKTLKLLDGAAKQKGRYLNLDEIIDYLYDVRSKFVHVSSLILQISDRPIVGCDSDGDVEVYDLSLEKLKIIFKHGFLIHHGYPKEQFS